MTSTKSVIHVGLGSVVVENPPQRLLEGLRLFRRAADGSGDYEELFNLSSDGRTLVTMPGFARRVIDLCKPNGYTINERMPMPKPDLEAAVSGLPSHWHKTVLQVVKSTGGIVGVPEMLGGVAMTAAILRAFPRDALVERGTPLSIIATHDRDSAKNMAVALRRMFPDRDIGVSSVGSYTDSDDIIVAPYGALDNIQCWQAGVFIAHDLPGYDFIHRATGISALRNATRWGIYETAGGGCYNVDMTLEGLFGPIVSVATYGDAVAAGAAVPITVCWMPAPKPDCSWGYAPFKMLEATAMQGNERFCRLVADIMNRTPEAMGCIACSEYPELLERVSAFVDGGIKIHRGIPKKGRNDALKEVISGKARRVLASFTYCPCNVDHGVMVMATCGGGNSAGRKLPWRPLKGPNDRAYIIDFRHDWDLHNGHQGRLALNDEARAHRYHELGFRQMFVDSMSKLPFMGG